MRPIYLRFLTDKPIIMLPNLIPQTLLTLAAHANPKTYHNICNSFLLPADTCQTSLSQLPFAR